MRKSILAAAAAFALAGGAMVGQASAADLYVAPPPLMAPPPVFVPTWAGFYVGGHLGYGETKFDFRQDVDFSEDPLVVVDPDASSHTFRSSVSPDGLVGGVQGGYNWQVNSLVFGIEGDVSFTDWGGSSAVFDTEVDDVDDLGLLGEEGAFGTASGDIDFIVSVRGRVGYAIDNVMFYGTGGVAWADAEARARVVVDDGDGGVTLSGKKNLNDFGLVAGGGLAWMVIPQTFSVGVEGLYYWFKESKTLINEPIALDDAFVDVRATAELHDTWVVRARADFHF